jgi:hypothetical protein
MKYRPHRGSLDSAMSEMVELEPTLGALAVHLKVPPDTIKVEPYGYDKRIDWDTYMVLIWGVPSGFTDGPLRSES